MLFAILLPTLQKKTYSFRGSYNIANSVWVLSKLQHHCKKHIVFSASYNNIAKKRMVFEQVTTLQKYIVFEQITILQKYMVFE